MATEETRAAMKRELGALSEYGATLPELLDHVEEQNGRLGRTSFTDDQEEELQLHCWAVHKRRSTGMPWGVTRVWGTLEDDIGA
jgi:hypothetical protein